MRVGRQYRRPQEWNDKMKQHIIINDDTTATVDRDSVEVGQKITVVIHDENGMEEEITGTVTEILD